MSGRFALVIGNSRYNDGSLGRLKAPDIDVQELARVLKSPDVGRFDEVVTLLNEDCASVRRAIARFYDQRQRDDLLLLYFSGHGVKDEQGHLYLAVRDTESALPAGSAIETAFITGRIDRGFSKRQVLVLDCCHSGAFAHGAKAARGASVGTAEAFEGTGLGRVVLTATDSTQYAWEGDQIIGDAQTSLFTHFLIEGLKTGAADRDEDGDVTVDELYDYVREQVLTTTPRQTPHKWSYRQHGDIVLAQNPFAKRSVLPAEIEDAINNTRSGLRLEAVGHLESLLHGEDAGLAQAALGALKALSIDDSRKVAKAAAHVLRTHEGNTVGTPDTAIVPPATDTRDPERPSDIFISYAHGDHEKARALADVLVARGWKVWWDRKIAPGEAYDVVIERELGTCKCAIVLWSARSVHATWVRNEARRAARRQVLLPILIDAVEMPLEFENLQAADLTSWSETGEHPGLETVIDRVLALSPVPNEVLARNVVDQARREVKAGRLEAAVARLERFRPRHHLVSRALAGLRGDSESFGPDRAEAVGRAAAAARLERERVEAERREAEAARLERERVEAERRAAEAARIERERVEAERREAEAARLERERVEAERREAEAARLERERVEAERREAEAARLERERVEAERREAEAARLERERVEAERREAEAARLERERAEAERREAEAVRLERERAEAERVEADAARLARARSENARRKAEAARIDRERAEAAHAASEGAAQRHRAGLTKDAHVEQPAGEAQLRPPAAAPYAENAPEQRYPKLGTVIDAHRSAPSLPAPRWLLVAAAAVVALIAVAWFARNLPGPAVDVGNNAPQQRPPVARLETPAVKSTGAPTPGAPPVPTPVPDEAQPTAPAVSEAPPNEPAARPETGTAASRSLGDLRSSARTLWQTGAREKALTTATAGLRINSSDPVLNSLVNTMLLDARQRERTAREDASESNAQRYAQVPFQEALKAEREAVSQQRAKHLDTAIRGFWLATDRFKAAAVASKDAAKREEAAAEQAQRPQPARAPEPPPTQARQTDSERGAAERPFVDQVLRQYEAAHTSLTVANVYRLYRSAPIDELAKDFANSRSYILTIYVDDARFFFTPGQTLAVVKARMRHDVAPKTGQVFTKVDEPQIIELEKLGGTWVIRSIRAGGAP